MSFFSVNILTPSKVIAKELPAESLIIPVDRGQIEVLHGHTHIIEKLGTGTLIVRNGGEEQLFTVTSGICKLLDNKINIIANVSEPMAEINVDRAKKALVFATDKLSNSKDLSDEDRVKYTRKIQRAEVRIEIASKK
ncbi:MAG: F0F1 ATP synthase subunit epsilon [Bacteriovoracaceae bacterium]|nr:F0F1 ATP synthase subunit epsilon [Bacteriovoracaceae bacterium]